MNQSTISSGSALLSEEGSRISNNSNTTVNQNHVEDQGKKLLKLSSQPAKPSSMMKIKYGGAAKKHIIPYRFGLQVLAMFAQYGTV